MGDPVPQVAHGGDDDAVAGLRRRPGDAPLVPTRVTKPPSWRMKYGVPPAAPA